MLIPSLRARVPSLRASDYPIALQDPFRYLLCRRLMLVPRFDAFYSEALSHGSWMHTCFEHDTLKAPSALEEYGLVPGVRQALSKRLAEITRLCKENTVPPDTAREIMSREEEDCNEALAFYCASGDVPISGNRTFRHLLGATHLVPLAREMVFSYNDPLYPGTPLVIQPDLLLLHTNTKEIWIVDLKSTDKPPIVRLSICPVEHQFLHYTYVLNALLASGQLHALLPSLPNTVAIGGMIHVAIRKPGIRLSNKDRNFTLDTTPLKSGPRKGEPRNERIYVGEPLFSNYLNRVRTWYAAADEYTHLAKEWAAFPPVNRSHVSADSFLSVDSPLLKQYHSRLKLHYHYATCDPDPSLFPQNPDALIPYNNPSVYHPFAFHDPSTWRAIAQKQHLAQKPRAGDPA